MSDVIRSARRGRCALAVTALASLIASSLGGCGPGRSSRAEAAPTAPEPVVKVLARQWEFVPSRLVLRKGVPVVLELSSADRHHGFSVPGLGVRGEINPGERTHLRLVPTRLGTFTFHCHVFCGEGHEEMTGEIVVAP